jgi:hypothetical protein
MMYAAHTCCYWGRNIKQIVMGCKYGLVKRTRIVCRILVDRSFKRELCAARQGEHWWVVFRYECCENVNLFRVQSTGRLRYRQTDRYR